MTNSPAGLPQTAEPPVVGSEKGSGLLFLAGSIAVTVGLSIAAAHAPARIRLLGVFSIGFGLLLGWLVTRLAATLTYRINVLQVAWIGILSSAGLVGSVCHMIAIQPVASAPTIENAVPKLFAIPTPQSRSSSPAPKPNPMAALFAAQVHAESRTFGSRMHRYLTERVQMLGAWPSPWPELFWGTEVLAGTAAAIGIARKRRSQELPG